jgi:peptidoglycan/LPS O-acetylase OafA/YrhL
MVTAEDYRSVRRDAPADLVDFVDCRDVGVLSRSPDATGIHLLTSLLTLLAVLVGGTGALVWARARALRRAPDDDPGPSGPLSPGERLTLRRWERRLRRVFVFVGVAYLLLVGTSLSGLEPDAFGAALGLALLAAVLLLGALVQFSEKCPHCGFNLGFQARLLRPAGCERCGGSFR